MNGKSFIKTENLTYSYEDAETGAKITALRGISLEIERGSFVAVLGHNGSGKSTFAKLLNMILTPESGEIYVDGELVSSAEEADMETVFSVRRKIGMVHQNPDNQIVSSVIEEDVAFGPENLGVLSDEIRRRVDEALEAVGMTEYAKHSPSRLSGGQKQRIAIAGIIAMMPECIIFDESTAMLDPVGRSEVLETIEKLKNELGITVILITHDMSEAARAERIVVLDHGRVYLDGTPAEVFSKVEKLRGAGLDVPQSTALLYELRDLGFDYTKGNFTSHDCAVYIKNILDAKRGV